MDWLPIVIILATASFLLPILSDYKRKAPALKKRLSALEFQIHAYEKEIAAEKEEESSAKAELKEYEQELAGIDKDCHEFRKLIDSKTKKR